MDDSFSRQRGFLLSLYRAAVQAALPQNCLPPYLPPPPKGRLALIAIGKAASSMAAAAQGWYATNYPSHPVSGIALTRYGHGFPIPGIEVPQIELMEAGHPVPDRAGMEASERILALARSLTKDDMALVLLSGGGSALAALPLEGMTIEDKQVVTRALLASGAPIADINTVRKHLSRIKGGWLAEAIAPAHLLTLAISDVAGDEASVIASGPTVADPSSKDEADTILRNYGISLPAHVARAMSDAPETPKPDAAIFADARFEMVASGANSLAAAEAMARAHGYEVINLGDRIEGEAFQLGQKHAELALQTARSCALGGKPTVILSGGEVSVTFDKKKADNKDRPVRGGPSQEYALALAMGLQSARGISALAADTDGIDGGSGDAADPAGAMVFPDTLARAKTASVAPSHYLSNHDSGSFFSALDDLIVTGPSFTNVNDFRAILIES